MNSNVLEIRNYLLKPGTRESFITYFEDHFIASQEDLGMSVLGQFRVVGESDHFVWLRGFSDMQARLEGLQNFYGGPVWEQYGPYANDLMLEWHNVHLLRPISSTDALVIDGTLSSTRGLVAIDFYRASSAPQIELLRRAYQSAGIQVHGVFAAEMSENTFTRLPVIQNADEVVIISTYASEAACHSQRTSLPHVDGFGAPVEVLLLTPTQRSALHYLP